MEGGTAHFGRRGQKSPKLKKVVKKFSTYGPRGTAHRDLKGRRQRTSRDGAVGPGRGGVRRTPCNTIQTHFRNIFFRSTKFTIFVLTSTRGPGDLWTRLFFSKLSVTQPCEPLSAKVV